MQGRGGEHTTVWVVSSEVAEVRSQSVRLVSQGSKVDIWRPTPAFLQRAHLLIHPLDDHGHGAIFAPERLATAPDGHEGDQRHHEDICADADRGEEVQEALGERIEVQCVQVHGHLEEGHREASEQSCLGGHSGKIAVEQVELLLAQPGWEKERKREREKERKRERERREREREREQGPARAKTDKTTASMRREPCCRARTFFKRKCLQKKVPCAPLKAATVAAVAAAAVASSSGGGGGAVGYALLDRALLDRGPQKQLVCRQHAADFASASTGAGRTDRAGPPLARPPARRGFFI